MLMQSKDQRTNVSSGAWNRASISRPKIRCQLGALVSLLLPLLAACLLLLVDGHFVRHALATESSGLALNGGSAGADAEPFWGCESPALSPGAFHVVVSTFNAEPEQLLPWIWHLGLTNVAVYVYHRLEVPGGGSSSSSSSDGGSSNSSSSSGPAAGDPASLYAGVVLPCSMALHVAPLTPNKGREAAVFLHHLAAHYDRLPEALMLVHDHGPASRHSLCGPFYRRARGYYRGLLERAQLAAAAGGGAVRPGKQHVFARFSGMVVTLSSGCAETWARGCCATLLCSNSPAACPFQGPETANCTTHEADRRAASGLRQFYLHANGQYDPRYDNQVVGPGGAAYPVALIRYAGAAHRSTEMWNISHEYPPDQPRRSKDETLQLLRDLLARHNFAAQRLTHFKSCCASLLLRAEHVRRWPVELYRELLAYSMDPSMDYEATKAVSGPGWALWADRDYGRRDVLDYLRVDTRLKAIQGCPAQRWPALQRLLAGIRGRQAAQAGAAGTGGL